MLENISIKFAIVLSSFILSSEEAQPNNRWPNVRRRLNGTLAKVDISRVPFYYPQNACYIMSVYSDDLRSRILLSKVVVRFIPLQK